MFRKSNFIRIFCIVLIDLMPFLALAVSQKEMEQARTIAAKAYIRYVNDGSGYLDELHPVTIDELQKSLKQKEKENIKAFLAIEAPKDYQSWDKQQLLDYWAGTVFKANGLVEKGRGGRILARKEINKMTVSTPQAVTPQPAAQTQAPADSEAKPPVTESAPQQEVKKEETPKIEAADETMALSNVEDSISAAEQKLTDQLYADEEEASYPEEENYTWVYIMILAILVAIVIALVVYAANVMKKRPSDVPSRIYSEDDSEPDSHVSEKYEAALADKDFEISMLTKKLEASLKQNSELKTKLEALTSEIAALQATGLQTLPQEPKTPGTSASQRGHSLRTIYLGRANARQIFIRADRSLNIGNSVFVLDTTDGVTGSFRVADSPAAWSLALSNPEEYLKNACTGHDLEDTSGVSSIVTESSGTAVFEGGTWRVIRKAKIRYE